MKYTILLFFSFFIAQFSFSQETVNLKHDFIYTAINDNYKSYYELRENLSKHKLSNEEINVLLNESKKRNYIIGEILAYNLLGRSFRKKTLFNNALNNYEKALKLSRKTKDTGAEIVTLNQIGVVYRRLDKIKKALDYNQAALELASKVENPSKDIMMSISISNNNIGNIYLTLKQYELALKKFKKSILAQKKLGDKRGLAINNQNIGFTYKNLGFLEEALDYYNISLDYNLAIKSELGKVICYQSISDVLLLQGKHTKALKQIKKIVKLSEKIGNKYYISLVYRSLGHAQLKLNQFDESEASLKKALNIATTYDFPTIINEANLCLSELYDKKKEYEKALNYYKKAIESERKTFNDKNLTYVHNLTSKYDTEVSKNKITSLAKENEINSLKLLRNRNVLIIALVSIGLLGVLLYSMYRQRLLNDDKKILNLEQQALRIQMNPHFVFNALNSIKLYIINNEQRNAVYYLNKFSKLIRNILESSTIKEVTLREELDTMKLYMSIENIRFSNEIEYIENISNDVNQHQIKIPPLSLQPFLENAIWHGLSSKKGEKKVTLSVLKNSENTVKIDVIDNGIGRDAAFKIKNNKTLNRKSVGIDLTKERLENFSEEYENDYSLTYTDLIDENNNPIGTKVSLILPII